MRITVKFVVSGGQPETMDVQAISLRVGQQVKAKPVFRDCSRLPHGWSVYKITGKERQGCLIYEAVLLKANDEVKVRTVAPAPAGYKVIKAKFSHSPSHELSLWIKGHVWQKIQLGETVEVCPFVAQQKPNAWVKCQVVNIYKFNDYQQYQLEVSQQQ